jgi:hypothetical protein
LKFERASIEKKKWHTPSAKVFKVLGIVGESHSDRPSWAPAGCMIQWDKRPTCPVLNCFEGPSAPLQALLSSSAKALPHSNDGLFHLILGDEASKKV